MEDTKIMRPAIVRTGTALVAAQDPSIATRIRRPLLLRGMRVSEARSAAAAVRMACWFRPDVLFLDPDLPGITDETLGKIAASEVSIVSIGGSWAPDGISAILDEPYCEEDLVRIIQEVLARRRTTYEP